MIFAPLFIKITVRSSDYDRTLASAYSNLLGIYSSPKSIQLPENMALANEWPKTLPWEPIPVHTVAKPLDHVCYWFFRTFSK